MQLIIAAILWLIPALASALSLSYTDGSAASPSGQPSLSSCGSSPTLDSASTNEMGLVTVGTGLVTGCTITFSQARASTPICLVGSNSTTALIGYSVSTTVITINASLTIGAGKIYYFCRGN
ncbi:MAG: hypothetical protein KGL39_18725 [Patescibacteria group bacterium]|nr:hypothetical protein [Patescibacteria group bacterium]